MGVTATRFSYICRHSLDIRHKIEAGRKVVGIQQLYCIKIKPLGELASTVHGKVVSSTLTDKIFTRVSYTPNKERETRTHEGSIPAYQDYHRPLHVLDHIFTEILYAIWATQTSLTAFENRTSLEKHPRTDTMRSGQSYNIVKHWYQSMHLALLIEARYVQIM